MVVADPAALLGSVLLGRGLDDEGARMSPKRVCEGCLPSDPEVHTVEAVTNVCSVCGRVMECWLVPSGEQRRALTAHRLANGWEPYKPHTTINYPGGKDA